MTVRFQRSAGREWRHRQRRHQITSHSVECAIGDASDVAAEVRWTLRLHIGSKSDSSSYISQPLVVEREGLLGEGYGLGINRRGSRQALGDVFANRPIASRPIATSIVPSKVVRFSCGQMSDLDRLCVRLARPKLLNREG